MSCKNHIPYTIGNWKNEEYGSHRVLLMVPEMADAVRIRIPWNRRDLHPRSKAVVLLETRSQQRINNLVTVEISRESGEFIFQPQKANPGFHELYYLPYRLPGNPWAPETEYFAPEETADPEWIKRNHLTPEELSNGKWKNLPQADIVEFQARKPYDNFYPMEIPAPKKDVNKLCEQYPQNSFLVFHESCNFPIKMRNEIPLHWLESSPAKQISLTASKNEYLAFQLGILAVNDCRNLQVELSSFQDDKGNTIPRNAFTCYNLEGRDWQGADFTKIVDLKSGRVAAFWIGLDIPELTSSGIYHGNIKFHDSSDNCVNIKINITIFDTLSVDREDGNLEKYSRLRWINSDLGRDDETVEPFTPFEVSGSIIKCLGREITIGSSGLLKSVVSKFDDTVTSIDAAPTELLAAPIRMLVNDQKIISEKYEFKDKSPGCVSWESQAGPENLRYKCYAAFESDGYLNYKITLVPETNMEISGVKLEIPLRKSVAVYMMGMGCKGGYRPESWDWQWNQKLSNNQIWIGDVNAGIAVKLKHIEEDCAPLNLLRTGSYRDWSIGEGSGCRIYEPDNNTVTISATSGKFHAEKDRKYYFNFGLMITPFKPLLPERWDQRYYQRQAKPPFSPFSPEPETVKKYGANVVIMHHALLNVTKHINCPVSQWPEIRKCVERYHKSGLKVLIYYTIRELSVFARDFWIFRALGNEIIGDISGHRLADLFAETPEESNSKLHKGHAWLHEHLRGDYTPAWHCQLTDNTWDIAVAIRQNSRMLNYFVASLDWLFRCTGIDGLYIDGIDCDRHTMRRMRKVINKIKPDAIIDFHSGNSFHPDYGLASPANKYMELLPYIDSTWFGEGYDYNESPDYWMTEICTIPFGVPGQMLKNGGNPWRGMLYGMTGRLGWIECFWTPYLWKLWDEFGIRDARMLGYWTKECPVKTDSDDVLVTVYHKPEKSLIAIASWSPGPVEIKLIIDWEKLGIDPANAKIHAPKVGGELQIENNFTPNDSIPVAPGKGWWLFIE